MIPDTPFTKETLKFQVIGKVENNFEEPNQPDKIRAEPSRIVLDPSLVPGLHGLEPGMKILVIFCFHRSNDFDLTLFQHPRGDKSKPRRGVFSLRSPLRPNPIGVTEVELVSINDNILTVNGLDAINDSPVLDLKPV